MSIVVASAFLAFSIALPFGPVSLMCVQRSMFRGAHCGLICGAGASTAHGLFASLAILGAGTIASVLAGWQPVIQVASGVTLIAIGSKIVLKVAGAPQSAAIVPSLFTDYGAGLITALSNPITVVSYLAIASSGAMTDRVDLPDLAATIAGVILGSISWYAIISSSAWILRGRLPPHLLRKLNLFGGAILIFMGLRLAIFP